MRIAGEREFHIWSDVFSNIDGVFNGEATNPVVAALERVHQHIGGKGLEQFSSAVTTANGTKHLKSLSHSCKLKTCLHLFT